MTDERSHEMQPEPQRPLPSEFGAYISRFCEATATHDDMARLEHWLGQDDELLEQFLLTMEIHSSLSWQARSRSLASGDSGQSPASPPIEALPAGGASQHDGGPTGSTGVAAQPPRIAPLPGDEPATRIFRLHLPTVLAFAAVAIVASIASWTASRWWNKSEAPLDPAVVALVRNDIPLVTKLQHERDTTTMHLYGIGYVVFDESADFELIGPKRARLNRGRIKFHVTEPTGHGFVVETPYGEVTDLGTKFGLNVSDDDGAGLVVFEGSVDLRVGESERAPDGTDPKPKHIQRLFEGEGVIFGKGSAERIMAIRTGRVQTFRRVFEKFDAQQPTIVNVWDNLQVDETKKYYEIVYGGMREDALAYVDRQEHEWNGVTEEGMPAYLLGADYIKPFNDDRFRDRLNITVALARPAKLYVFYDNRLDVPDWLKRDFRDTSDTIGLDEGIRFDKSGRRADTVRGAGPGNSVDRRFTVWERIVQAPGEVTLGPVKQGSSAGSAMYGIAAVPLLGTRRPIHQTSQQWAK